MLYRSDFDVIMPEKIKEIKELFINKEFSEIMSQIQNIVLNTFRLDGYHDKALYLKEFDDILDGISKHLNLEADNIDLKINNKITILIGSEFYNVGGHTRVSRELVNLTDNVLVIVTDIYNRCNEDVEYYRLFQNMFENVPVVLIPPGSILEKTQSLIMLLKNINPDRVILMNHHDDPIGVTAIAQSGIPKKIYYHHADHNPALGATISKFMHVDSTPYLASKCSKYCSSNYLPLMYDQKIFDVVKYNKDQNFNTICVGSSIKFNFKNSEEIDYYPKVISEIGSLTNGLHYHIGALADSEMTILREYYFNHGLDFERFKYLGAVSNIVEHILRVNNPLFIISFPTAGGMTFIEALSTGVPLIDIRLNTNSDSSISYHQSQSILPNTAFQYLSKIDFLYVLQNIKENYCKIVQENIQYFLRTHASAAVEGEARKILFDDAMCN
jgi:protein O-GlcNAc transferase